MLCKACAKFPVRHSFAGVALILPGRLTNSNRAGNRYAVRPMHDV